MCGWKRMAKDVGRQSVKILCCFYLVWLLFWDSIPTWFFILKINYNSYVLLHLFLELFFKLNSLCQFNELTVLYKGVCH